jgi:hypothetical protein
MIWETLYKDLSGSAWTRPCVVIISTIKASLRRVYGTLGEEHRLREFENKMLRRIHRPRKKEVTQIDGENETIKSCIACILLLILIT